jgi:hypothetical protein
MLQQISVYRDGILFANVEANKPLYMRNIAQVPSIAMTMIRNYACGSGTTKKYGPWTWEWRQIVRE